MSSESMMYFDDRGDFESFISYHVKRALKDVDIQYQEDIHKSIISEQCRNYTYVMFAVRGLTRNDLVGVVTSALYRCRTQSEFGGNDPGNLFDFGAEGLPLARK